MPRPSWAACSPGGRGHEAAAPRRSWSSPALPSLFLGWRLLAPHSAGADTSPAISRARRSISPPRWPGRVRALAVRRGQRVAAGMRLFLIEPDQQRRAGPAGRGRARRRARPGRGCAQGPAPGRARASSRPTATPPRPRRARRGSRSTAPTRWSGAASTPGSGSTRRAPPIRAPRRGSRRRGSGSRSPTLGQREDQVRAADARVAQAAARVSETGARLGTPVADRALGRRGSRRSSTSAANGRRRTSRSSP